MTALWRTNHVRRRAFFIAWLCFLVLLTDCQATRFLSGRLKPALNGITEAAYRLKKEN